MSFIKKIIPQALLKFIRPYYHGVLALAASFYFGWPSQKMMVIGLTGTVGKSTTAGMLAHILNWAGLKTGYITTVNFFDGEKDYINKHGLSMPGGWLLQKHLAQMVSNGCRYAVVECTSEGLAQNRHLGINFDVALFTNLSEAHLQSHGSFGNYRAAKNKLFTLLGDSKRKVFFPKKMIGVNFDDAMSGYFLSSPADKKFGTSFTGIKVPDAPEIFYCNFTGSQNALEFKIRDVLFSLNIPGEFNTKNAALAAACANMLGVELAVTAEALRVFKGVPGRMQEVENNLGIRIFVDYGCEPASFTAALKATSNLPHKRLIHVFGSTGGHRDASKRFIFGRSSAQFADYIIVTNDDVYDSNPDAIAGDIEKGIKDFKLKKTEYKIVLDRCVAIHRALEISQTGDLILITGKGSEQFLVLPGNKRIEWDEVSVVKEELSNIYNS